MKENKQKVILIFDKRYMYSFMESEGCLNGKKNTVQCIAIVLLLYIEFYCFYKLFVCTNRALRLKQEA